MPRPTKETQQKLKLVEHLEEQIRQMKASYKHLLEIEFEIKEGREQQNSYRHLDAVTLHQEFAYNVNAALKHVKRALYPVREEDVVVKARPAKPGPSLHSPWFKEFMQTEEA